MSQLASPEDLRAVPLFAELSDDNLAELARTIAKQRAQAGQVLFREDECGDRMYVILAGAVTLHKVVDDHETELGRLESGAYFGEMALIGNALRTATIVAADEVEYLAIDRETLMRVIAAYPAVALQMLKGYNARLAETTERLARLSVRHVAASAARRALGPEEAYQQAVEQVIARGPYPLATLVRKIWVERDWSRKVLQALDLFEVVVKYTAMVLLADYLRSTARAPELDQMIAAAFRRPTLGQVIETCARVLRGYAGREHELFIPELSGLYYHADGGRAPAARAFQALTTYRNRLKHGAEGSRDDESFRRDFEGPEEGAGGAADGLGVKQQITTILDEVAVLEAYPLVYPVSMTYEHGAFEYSFERCTGAYADFDHGVFVHPEPLENRQLYLLADDGRVLQLEPLLRRRKCPTCAQPAIFTLFGFFPTRERAVRPEPTADAPAPASAAGAVRREKLEYLSYTCGHALVEQLSRERIARGEGLSTLLES